MREAFEFWHYIINPWNYFKKYIFKKKQSIERVFVMAYKKISGFSDEIASDIVTQFEVLNKLGIEYFEPRGVNGKSISELTEEEVLELKETMEKYGIKASSIGSPVGKIKLSEDFETHFEMYKNVVKTAKTLGTKYIRMFSFWHDEEGAPWTEEERAEVFLRLKKMIAYAKEQDVVLLHENEKDIYGDIAPRCLDLMKELACDNFKAVFDPANFVQSDQDTKEAYEMLKNYIEYIHIKDARFADHVVVPAGCGDGNVKFILDSIFADGYDGFLSLEPHLGRFVGLGGLETGDMMKDLPEGGEGTFTLAYESLVALL